MEHVQLSRRTFWAKGVKPHGLSLKEHVGRLDRKSIPRSGINSDFFQDQKPPCRQLNIDPKYAIVLTLDGFGAVRLDVRSLHIFLMEQTLHDLSGILLRAIPSAALLIILHFYLKGMLFKPLQKVLKQREMLTAGAAQSGR